MDIRNIPEISEKVYKAVEKFYFKLRPNATMEDFLDEMETSYYDDTKYEERHLFFYLENAIRFYDEHEGLITELLKQIVMQKELSTHDTVEVTYYILCRQENCP